MIAFIDDHRGAHGVEPICKVLPIAPSTYHAHVAKRRDPAKLSARARQDAALKIEVRRVFDQNFSVYGVRKVWRRHARWITSTASSRRQGQTSFGSPTSPMSRPGPALSTSLL
jgi:hypothetical protein